MFSKSHGQALTLFLLGCALFLRAWVPAGWMPDQARGAFAITPCPGAALVQTLHAMDEHHRGQGHHSPFHNSDHEGDCAFAPLQAGYASPSPIAFTFIEAAPEASPGETRLRVFPPAGRAALLPPSTGPPQLA